MSLKTYRIGEAAELLNLKSYVLRFWETEFTQLEPLRTDKGQRLYTEEHIRLLLRIKYLLHERGLTIEGAKRMLSEQQAGLTGVDLLAESRAAGEALPDLSPSSNEMASGRTSSADRGGPAADRAGGSGQETGKKAEAPEAPGPAQMRLKAYTDNTLNFLDSLRPDFGMDSGAPQRNQASTSLPDSLTAREVRPNSAPKESPGQPEQPEQPGQLDLAGAHPASATPGKPASAAVAAPSGAAAFAAASQVSPSFENETGTGAKAGTDFIRALLNELEELRRMLKA